MRTSTSLPTGVPQHLGDRAGDRFRLTARQLNLQYSLDRPTDNGVDARGKSAGVQLARGLIERRKIVTRAVDDKAVGVLPWRAHSQEIVIEVVFIRQAGFKSVDKVLPVNTLARNVRHRLHGDRTVCFRPTFGLRRIGDDGFIDPAPEAEHAVFVRFRPFARRFRGVTQRGRCIAESLKKISECGLPLVKLSPAQSEVVDGQPGDHCLERIDREIGATVDASMEDKPRDQPLYMVKIPQGRQLLENPLKLRSPVLLEDVRI